MATISDMIKNATAPINNNKTASKAIANEKKNSGYYSYKLNGKTYYVKPASEGGYMGAYKQYAKDANAQKNLYNQQYNTNISNLQNTLAQNNATTNANYDSSARQAYVDYMRKQKALPSQLEALGVNGGASETGQLNLYNNYGVTHAANEQQRNADLTANQQAYNDAYNKLVSDRTQYLMDWNKDLATQKQTALANQMNEYNNEVTRFSSSVAQYPTTEKGYKSYQKWIKKLQKSNDPLKKIKIGLVRQQMATQFPNGLDGIEGAGGSGGGGGGGRRGGYSRSGYSSGGGGSDSGSTTANASANVNAANTKGQSMTEYYKNAYKKNKTKATKKVPSHGIMQ